MLSKKGADFVSKCVWKAKDDKKFKECLTNLVKKEKELKSQNPISVSQQIFDNRCEATVCQPESGGSQHNVCRPCLKMGKRTGEEIKQGYISNMEDAVKDTWPFTIMTPFIMKSKMDRAVYDLKNPIREANRKAGLGFLNLWL